MTTADVSKKRRPAIRVHGVVEGGAIVNGALTLEVVINRSHAKEFPIGRNIVLVVLK